MTITTTITLYDVIVFLFIMAKNKVFDWTSIYNEILSATRKIAKDRYENHLERILGAFDTRIPVGIEEFARGDSYIFVIGPLEGPKFERETDGEMIDTSQLFRWLNEGTSVKHIRMIGDYNLESFPNSLVTINANNSGVTIIATKTVSQDGIEARNWLNLLEERYRDELPKAVNARITKIIK